jgi:hypothetical protein
MAKPPPLELDPDLDSLANRLKKAFAESKTEQHGKKYKPADRFKNMAVWYGVARKCLELNADPEDFIEAAFMYCSVPGGPFPQNLASRAMDRWYGEMTKSTGGDLKPGETVYSRRLGRLITDTMVSAMRLSKLHHKRLQEILLDDSLLTLDLCPAHIRVLLLSKDPAIVAKWGAKARSEIMSNPRLLKTLTGSTFDLTWL